ncbi:MAG: hypothetical protein ABJF01_15750 [bacterium]
MPSSSPSQAPSFLRGEFQDDYGERHSISASEWVQRPRNRFHIVQWVPSRTFLIAHNDSANRGDAGRWTRIDWLRLDGMAPYEWAFCFSAYDAPSAAAAESVAIAHPETPKTGCNGFPYTRMRRIGGP